MSRRRLSASTLELLDEDLFLAMLRFERKRTERSNRRFVLMLLESDEFTKAPTQEKDLLQAVVAALSGSIRETDIKGWYKRFRVVGVIFTEVGTADGKSITNALLLKVTKALGTALSIEQVNNVQLSFHVFPDAAYEHGDRGPSDSPLYPELTMDGDPKRGSRLVKRCIDIAGSLFALAALSPVFVLIAAAIKFTSKGPILFKQQRVGRYGRIFTFLKFRSMYFRSDQALHLEYVQRLIAGDGEPHSEKGRKAVIYKMTNDPRVTRVGRFLRKASLDELPQFVNVLRGEMSLVGPRPPLPYEFACYDIWHKQRLVVVQPGITGLWQVTGRSRTTFDEMVRLDLKYANSWSVWGDIKILFRTPWAVFSGEGAY